jgi:hypothetical protein
MVFVFYKHYIKLKTVFQNFSANIKELGTIINALAIPVAIVWYFATRDSKAAFDKEQVNIHQKQIELIDTKIESVKTDINKLQTEVELLKLEIKLISKDND